MKKLVIFNILSIIVFIGLFYWFLIETVSLIPHADEEITLFSITFGVSTDSRKTIFYFPLYVFIFGIVGNIYIYKKYARKI